MKMNDNEDEDDDDDDDSDSGSIVTSRSQLQFQRSKKSHLIRIYSALYLNHMFCNVFVGGDVGQKFHL